jgi:hypothetical protein
VTLKDIVAAELNSGGDKKKFGPANNHTASLILYASSGINLFGTLIKNIIFFNPQLHQNPGNKRII